MVLTIIVALLNKKTMWSGEILVFLTKTAALVWGVPMSLWVISEALDSFFEITINQWVILIICIGLVVFLLIHLLRENKNQKVLLRFSKEKNPEFLQILSSKLLLSNTETFHKKISGLTFNKCYEYSVCNTNGKQYIKLTDRGIVEVKASELLLEETDILTFKQECWNAYEETVIKTSPYFYLLPFLCFVTFIVSMIIFAHYYEFTSLYVEKLFYFTFLPMMLFAFMLSVSTSINSSKSKI
jgi:type IV secretory pathway VirB3-like protein